MWHHNVDLLAYHDLHGRFGPHNQYQQRD